MHYVSSYIFVCSRREVSYKCGGVRTCWIASYALCFGILKSGKFHKIFIQDIATLRCLWCILFYTRTCMRVPSYYNNICGVGFGVAVWIKRQYQSLRMRNSKIAVPLLIFISGTLFNRFPLLIFISGTQSEGPAFFLYICLREKI